MIGPSLPPHLAKEEDKPAEEEHDEPCSSSAAIGPSLPPSLAKRALHHEDESPEAKKRKSDESETIGPVLPGELVQKQNEGNGEEEPEDVAASIGPALPEGFKQHIEAEEENDEHSFGPALPPSVLPAEESDNEEEVGPQLPGANEDDSYLKRFIDYKIREDEQKKHESKREEWMLKCPQKKGASGLSYLSFSSEKPSDDTVESKGVETGESEALVDKHQRKMQKEREAAKDEPKERKPFNREEDMSMMSGGKKVDLNKLREHMGSLGSRFSSSGPSSKFL